MRREKDFRKKLLEDIGKTKFLSLVDFGDLLGYSKFKEKWDFQEILNSRNDWHRYTGFFEIYHNDIHFDLIPASAWESQKDFRLWKCGKVKFHHFRDWLSYILILSQHNIPKNLRNQFENGNLKDPHSEDSLFITDGNGIVELIEYKHLQEFLDEKIGNFLKNLNSPPNLSDERRVHFSTRNKEVVKFLFELLQENKACVEKLLANPSEQESLLKYFPPNKPDFGDADLIFENEWQSIQRFLEIKKILHRAIFKNEDVECFIQNQNGVYKKIRGLGKARISIGAEMFDGMILNVAFEERSGEEVLEYKPVQIFVSNQSAIKFIESLSEDSGNSGSKAGRPKEKDYDAVWKEFIEKILSGTICESSNDYAQQAFKAYNALSNENKNKLKFAKSNGQPHKGSILITIQELVASKSIGKTRLTDVIVTPFANKFPNNSSR